MRVLGNNVLVEILEDTITKAGIIIPESVDQSGGVKVKVAFTGDECKKVNSGDFVIVDPMRLPTFMYKVNDKKYYCLYEHSIIAVISEKDNVDFLVRELESEDK